jgi:integrase
MHDPANELRKIPLLGTSVNKLLGGALLHRRCHGYVPLLSKNVNPKIVSQMLGHATIAITLDTYSHVLPNMRDQAAQAMEEALS